MDQHIPHPHQIEGGVREGHRLGDCAHQADRGGADVGWSPRQVVGHRVEADTGAAGPAMKLDQVGSVPTADVEHRRCRREPDLIGEIEQQIGATRIQTCAQDPADLLAAQRTLGIHLLHRTRRHRWCGCVTVGGI
jgi:hypothetical protein